MDRFGSGLLTPLIESSIDSGGSSELSFFVNYISILEGVKTKIKNLHWAAKRLSITDKRGAHIYLDNLLDIVSGFQDTVAESSQGIVGIMELNAVSGTSFMVSSPKELLLYLKDKTISFYTMIPSSTVYVGIKSETETFIKGITRYLYLFQLVE